MTNNKKRILISWLIGLGSGLFISGIILSVLVYASNKTEPVPEAPNSQKQEVGRGTAPSSNGPELEKTKKIEEIVAEEEKTDQREDKMIELEIDSTATATEITNMLVEHNVISDYDEFMAYIVVMGAERKLIHGTKKFPLNSENEKVLEILTRYR